MNAGPSSYRTITHWYRDLHPPIRPDNPVNLMVLTSIRDVGACDKNGVMVRTPEGWKYMEGAVQAIVNATREGEALHGLINFVGVINDDHEANLRDSNYAVQPREDGDWIHPLNLRTQNGERVAGEDMTHWLPSDFRLINGAHEPEQKAESKMRYEAQIAKLMEQRNADVLLSDHYMARIEHLIGEQHGLYGRVLNIHPAVTVAGHPYCFRGPTPTTDAIDRAQTDPGTVSGATLHLVNSQIDDGPPIMHIEGTKVHRHDKPQDLRYRNYQQAKLPVLIAGLRHYVEQVYPHLNNHLSVVPTNAHVPASVTQ